MTFKQFILNNRRIATGMGFVSLIPLAVSSLITTFLIRYQSVIQDLTPEQWLPLFGLSVLTMAFAITPTTFIALVSGFFLGWQAAIPMVMAYLLASVLGYSAGRLLDGGRLLQGFPEAGRFHQLVNDMKQQDWLLMILVRISPVLPFSLINLLLPASGIRLSVFILAGFIGMLPRTLFFIWVGLQGQNLIQLLQTPNKSNLSIAIMIITAVLSIGGIVMIASRSVSKFIRNQ